MIDLKQKETELLVEYRTEIDSLYQQRAINHERIDEELIEERSLKGAMVQSRTKSTENEVTPSKFFYAAESVFQKSKIITALKGKSGKKVTTDKDILKTEQTFYEELYKKAHINKLEQDKLLDNYDKKLSMFQDTKLYTSMAILTEQRNFQKL